MSEKKCYNVTKIYDTARKASIEFNPGRQSNIEELMISSFVQGYAKALLDYGIIIPEEIKSK